MAARFMRIVNADPQQVLSAVMRIPRPSKTAVAFTGLGLATLGYAVKSGTSHMRTPAQIQWFGQTQTPTFKKYVVDEVGEPPAFKRVWRVKGSDDILVAQEGQEGMP